MSVQVCIPPALCALHNFIRRYDPDDLNGLEDEGSDGEPQVVLSQFGDLGTGIATREARERSSAHRDRIAQRMWEDYVALLQERGDV
jgi:hypothetical protein